MKSRELIENYMTHSPHTINEDMGIDVAQTLMKKYRVRHLPVQKGGALVGIVSERDLFLGRALDKTGKLLVKDVMTSEPYSVETGSPLGDVAEHMATGNFGCAVITDDKGKVCGIFTATDALRTIGDQRNAKARKSEIAEGRLA